MWGIKMGRQPHKDNVTGMLDGELWEDDATATTAASTAELTSLDEELSDEESVEDPVDKKTRTESRQASQCTTDEVRPSKRERQQRDGMSPRWEET